MKKIIVKILSVIISFEDYLIQNFIMHMPIMKIRYIVLKLKFKSIGKNTSFLMGLGYRNPKNIVIGSNTVINKNVLLDGRGGKLIIGNNVDIAQETNIWTLQHDPNSNSHNSIGDNVTIEDYVWIASRVTILPGVKIGKGAVIASGAVVTKNVSNLTIVGGIPAKKIGIRKNNLSYSLNYKPLFK
ncbi:MAG: acyltransferase [Flavobacteriaceae bacterium]|nr:acyltransferase [Flavobacteriaceae bacterium]